ncbi:hypothetical protein BU25DRAFT_416018 [Macroventuria anomochaeta]|uniref:Uncharacterized protein n=1 Tax=Macroventuria anomochaeta TaxID=301207 RepID=A0ACB6RIT4_9PLEO|nr:uncharacterized protein BU25DRAFT_416018 [Macroventuria anomochaeta]KAF2621643.1 hypothetical protein BU25DRAFT_416018 [Macroventuria anomochaeta]
MSASAPQTTASPINANILIEASDMPTIARFHYLLHHTKAYIHSHGPYTTHANTTVFTRAANPPTKLYGPSSKCLATSLAAAQDCIGSAQVPGPAKEDLYLFKHLWDTTIDVFEEVLATGDLDHESFGWGIWGLCGGYMYPPSEASYELFEEHKHRLHEALLALPTVDPPRRTREELVVKGEGRVEVLAKANRQVHICDSLELQRFRQEGWHRIRWWHGVKVAERWIMRLGMVDEVELTDGPVEKERPPEPGSNVESTNGVRILPSQETEKPSESLDTWQNSSNQS